MSNNFYNHNHNLGGRSPPTQNMNEILENFAKQRTMDDPQRYFASTMNSPGFSFPNSRNSRFQSSYSPNSASSNDGHYNNQQSHHQPPQPTAKTIPIHVQHERASSQNETPSFSRQGQPTSTSSGSSPQNESPFGINHHHPQSFFSQPSSFPHDSLLGDRFRNSFSSSPFQHYHERMSGDSGASTGNSTGGEPRVRNIPIQVESRTANTTTTNSTNVNSGPSTTSATSQPQQQTQQAFNQYQTNRPDSRNSNNNQTFVNQTTATPNYSTVPIIKSQPVKSSAAPVQASFQQQQRPLSGSHYNAANSNAEDSDGSVQIPVQICKSSSTPEATKPTIHTTYKQPSATDIPNGSSVNESASDPAIVDPNKVYVMGYQPLAPKDPVDSNGNHNNNNTKTNVPTKARTPFDDVKEILSDLEGYKQQVIALSPTTTSDKGYRYLDEMLTRAILRLDCVMVDGNDELRKYRKSAINDVNQVASLLESKLIPNEQQKPENKSSVQNTVEEPEQAIEMKEDSIEPSQTNVLEEPKDTIQNMDSNDTTESMTMQATPNNDKDKLNDGKQTITNKDNEKDTKKIKIKKTDKKDKKEPTKRRFFWKGKSSSTNPSSAEAAVNLESEATSKSKELDSNNNNNNNNLKDSDGSSSAATASDQYLSENSTANSTSSSFSTLPGRETAV